MTDPLQEPLPEDREQAKALAKQMAAVAQGKEDKACAFGPHAMFYAPYREALVPGHIYSEAGLKEAGISGVCEFCFDQEFGEKED